MTHKALYNSIVSECPLDWYVNVQLGLSRSTNGDMVENFWIYIGSGSKADKKIFSGNFITADEAYGTFMGAKACGFVRKEQCQTS